MRVSRDVMAHRHDKIISETTKMLRRRGIVGTSLADLMAAAGLTHGGFYKHFESKEELVAEATQRIFTEIQERLRQRLEHQGPKAALRSYIDEYLSLGHLKAPEIGCPISSFGLDVGREQGAVRRTFTGGVKSILELITEGLSGSPAQRMDCALELMTMMSGAVALARATDDDKFARQILSAARKRAEKIVK